METQTYTYELNKGVGKTVEFMGLQAQYLVMFFAGLFVLLLTIIGMSAAGVSFFVNILVVALLCSVLLRYVFQQNRKHGRFGLMKSAAFRRLPKRLYRNHSYR